MLVNVAVCHRRISPSPFSLLVSLFSNFSLCLLSHCLCFPGEKQPQAITVRSSFCPALLSAVSMAIIFSKRISRGLRGRFFHLCSTGTYAALGARPFSLCFDAREGIISRNSGRKLSIKIRGTTGNSVTGKPS